MTDFGRNVVVVAHKFLTQPDDDLVSYLNDKKFDNVMHIRHSFSDAPDRCSYYTWYKGGKIFKEESTRDYRNSGEALIYLKESYSTLKWTWKSQLVWDTYIGMDGLCVFWGNVLRTLSRIRKTIYWAIDFVPENRFVSQLKNIVYHWINKLGYSKSDEMWDLSPRMAEAREFFLGFKRRAYRCHRVVPYGVWTERIRKFTYNECEKNTLVFMGHLLEKQGVQLVLAAIPEIIKHIPDFKFIIIGDGQYKVALTALARELNVASYCDFKGKIDSHVELENEIAKSCVAIAPYVKKLDTWTYYADPGKVKTYLACGVPVLLSSIPWNAAEIAERGCGRIISENPEDIARQAVFLMNYSSNQTARDQAIRYSQNYNYANLFGELQI